MVRIVLGSDLSPERAADPALARLLTEGRGSLAFLIGNTACRDRLLGSAIHWDRVLLARVSVPVRQADANAFPTLDLDALAAIAAAPAPAADAVQEPRWRDLADNSLRPIVFNPYSWRGAA